MSSSVTVTQTADSLTTLPAGVPQLGKTWTPEMFTGAPRVVRITPMQANVLTSLCEGKSNRLIARDWGISEDTAKSHLRALIKNTGARDRTHLVSQLYSGALRVWQGSLRRSSDF